MTQETSFNIPENIINLCEEIYARELKRQSNYSWRSKDTQANFAALEVYSAIYQMEISEHYDQLISKLAVKLGLSIADTNNYYNKNFAEIEKSFSVADMFDYLFTQLGHENNDKLVNSIQESSDFIAAECEKYIYRKFVDKNSVNPLL